MSAHSPLDSAQIEAAAKAMFCTMYSVMHDHDKLWRKFDKAWLYREAAEAALKAARSAA